MGCMSSVAPVRRRDEYVDTRACLVVGSGGRGGFGVATGTGARGMIGSGC